MKAAIYSGQGGPVTIETLADPRPAPDEVIIRVDRCGICGTDLAMTTGGVFDFGAGVQFGHEYAGEIIEVGGEVTDFFTMMGIPDATVTVMDMPGFMDAVAATGYDGPYGVEVINAENRDRSLQELVDLAYRTSISMFA